MRVLFVWFTALVAVFIITIGWYIGNGVVIAIAYQATSDFTGSAFSAVQLLEFVAAWWGPVLDVIVILWAILNSQEIDPNSRIYG
jgi:hypothetical protein